MTKQNKHLYYMNELSDYKISDGYPDVRGWDVKDIDNRVIGKVDNLLVNKDFERVVYLDVEVDKSIIDAKHDPYGRPNQEDIKEFVNKDGENHIIIPIGLVDLNEDSNYVYTDIIDHKTFSETKRYRKGDSINRQYEVQVLDSYGRKKSLITDKEKLVEEDLSKFQNDDRLREIIRDEIRKYHHDKSHYFGKGYAEDERHYRHHISEADDDTVILSEKEMELERKRRNNDVYDDDGFYERREFDDKRFKKRTPDL